MATEGRNSSYDPHCLHRSEALALAVAVRQVEAFLALLALGLAKGTPPRPEKPQADRGSASINKMPVVVGSSGIAVTVGSRVWDLESRGGLGEKVAPCIRAILRSPSPIKQKNAS